jgi:hypothetical protein
VGPALKVGLPSAMSRADLATFLVEEVLEPKFEDVVVCVRG